MEALQMTWGRKPVNKSGGLVTPHNGNVEVYMYNPSNNLAQDVDTLCVGCVY